MLALIATGIVSYGVYRNIENSWWAAFVLVAGMAVAFTIRNRERPKWFERSFALLFYVSSVAFAALHLLNQDVFTFGPELLLIFPQLVGGLVYGYSRVIYGLWSAAALHMANNGAFLALAIVA